MKNKKELILRSFLFWLIIPSLIGAFLIWLLLGEIKSEELKLDETNLNYVTVKQQLNSFDKIKKNFEFVNKEKNELESLAVNKEETLDLIKEIEKAAELANVKVKTEVSQDNPFKKIPQNTKAREAAKKAAVSSNDIWLKLELEGNFKGILRFVKYLENGNRLINIQTISIRQSEILTPETVFGKENISLGNLNVSVLVSNNF